MDEKKPNPGANEESLVKEYTELTGASETNARSVLIHLDIGEEEKDAKEPQPPGGKAGG
jgi:hypothetical protein